MIPATGLFTFCLIIIGCSSHTIPASGLKGNPDLSKNITLFNHDSFYLLNVGSKKYLHVDNGERPVHEPRASLTVQDANGSDNQRFRFESGILRWAKNNYGFTIQNGYIVTYPYYASRQNMQWVMQEDVIRLQSMWNTVFDARGSDNKVMSSPYNENNDSQRWIMTFAQN